MLSVKAIITVLAAAARSSIIYRRATETVQPVGDSTPKVSKTGSMQMLEQFMNNDLDNKPVVPVSLTSRRNFLGAVGATVAAGVLSAGFTPMSAYGSDQRGETTAMSYSISTLLTRNLQDVFGENDPVRRRAAIDEIWTEDGVFYDPKTGVHRGRDEIDRIAGAIRATHPDFRYQPIAKPEELGDGGRIRWVSGRPGEAPAYAGTDFIIAREGRIAALYLFFDKLP